MLAVSIRKALPGFTPDVGWAASEPIVALVGPSVSGKTLTLQALAGLVRPDARRIELDGRPLLDTGTGVDVPARRVVTIFVAYLVLAAAVGAGMARLLRLGPARLARSSSAPGPETRSSSCTFALALPSGWEAAVAVVVLQSLAALLGMLAYLRWVSRLIPDG